MKVEDLAYFEKYHTGQLSKPEVRIFEEKIKLDEEFAQSYDAYVTSIKLVKRAAVREHIVVFRPPRSHKILILSIILLVSALLISLILYFQPGKQKRKIDTSDLFAQYFDPLPDLFATRTTSSELGLAMNQYNEGNFLEALQLLDTAIYKQPEVKLYRAICRLALSEEEGFSFQDEIEYLDNISILTEYVKWYQSLSYLKKDDIGNATIILTSITPAEYKYREAKYLLQLLQKQ